jgi:[lysine-biosynthesis-protein LysW]---L-2-aminoadipate ligase
VSDGFRLGVCYTIIRPEEKWILAAAEGRGIGVERWDDRSVAFGLDRPAELPSVVLNRSVSHTNALYAAWCFEHYGVPTVSSARVLELAGDKARTSLRLAHDGIPTPRTIVALSPESALRAIETIGYPAVLKPAVGSWGRLMAKVDNSEQAVQILEHKTALASTSHSVFYVQEYVPKPERDLRAFVIGDEVVAAMYRRSSEWRTNAARGGSVEAAPVTPELSDLSLRAARSVGGGVVAVDLMESSRGLLVHEVNPTPEFKALTAATGVDVASRIVDFAVDVGRR